MKKTILLWYLYDFANSFISIVLIFYYPLILNEKNINTAWIGIPASIATGILLLILPYFGSLSDRLGKRIIFIRIGSLIAYFSIIVIAFLLQKTAFYNTSFLILITGLYILFQVCFQGCYMFYSAMLNSITHSGNNAKVSGIGFGLGQLGNVVSLTIAVPVIGSSILLYGLTGKTLVLFIGAVLSILISMPFLLQKESIVKQDKLSFSYISFIKKLTKQRRIFYFLVGYSLLADTILTFQLYIAVYIKKVFTFSDQMITYAGLTGLLCGVAGGILVGGIVNKFRDKEKTLKISSIIYGFCFALCALIPNIPLFVFLGIALSGVIYSIVFSLARTVYAEITPTGEQGSFFSIFTVFERAASIIGPLVWLLTFYLLERYGEIIQYRGSVLFLMVICFTGVYFINKSKRYITEI